MLNQINKLQAISIALDQMLADCPVDHDAYDFLESATSNLREAMVDLRNVHFALADDAPIQAPEPKPVPPRLVR